MEEQTIHTPANENHHIALRLVAGVVVCLLIVAATYAVQYHRTQTATSKASQLNGQVGALKAKLAALQTATNISTSGWNTYCDPADMYCLKYPSDWKIKQSSGQFAPGTPIASETITNPKGTLQITYNDFDERDSGPVSTYIDSVNSLDSTSVSAKVVGEYYLTSVDYQPFFVAADPNLMQGVIAGQSALWGGNIRFADQVQLIASRTGSSLTTRDQANAWFSSVDAKTALAVMRSLNKE